MVAVVVVVIFGLSFARLLKRKAMSLWQSSFTLLFFLVLFTCQRRTFSQRIDKLSCARKPQHTQADKTPGDNGFSIKIMESPPIDYYEPGHDYTSE